MQDILGLIASRRRPRILGEAARRGANAYCRDTHLARLLKSPTPLRHGEAIMKLLDLESELDTARRAAAPDYTARRHVAVLSAILGEARLMRAV